MPCWIVRVPKDIIWGHGGPWSDNSAAMLAALFRIHFPRTAQGVVAPPQRRSSTVLAADPAALQANSGVWVERSRPIFASAEKGPMRAALMFLVQSATTD